jgi:hypothetical protein
MRTGRNLAHERTGSNFNHERTGRNLTHGETGGIPPPEGLEDINIQPFIGIANVRLIVKRQSDKFHKGDSHKQYLIFARVGVGDLAKIDRVRNSIGKHTRMAHYSDIDLLTVKPPSAGRGKAHGNLAQK